MERNQGERIWFTLPRVFAVVFFCIKYGVAFVGQGKLKKKSVKKEFMGGGKRETENNTRKE